MSEPIQVPSAGEPEWQGEITEGKLDEILSGLLVPNQAFAKAMARKLRERDERIAELQKTLKAFYQKTGIIDNGYCAVCRCGHRLWKLPACRVPAGPCSNEECLSRKADALLEAK